jgi:hypothetical protein
MPRLNIPAEAFRPAGTVEITYDGFNGGLNTFFADTEIKRNELSTADNTMIIGKGIITGRWGSENYFLAGTGDVKLLDEYNNVQTSQSDLLAITDAGYLVKKSNASYSIITGASFASTAIVSGTQLGNNYYIVSDSTNLVRYDGTNLIPYIGIAAPTISGVSRLSGATGTTTWSYKITALTASGETLPSTAVLINNLPADYTLLNNQIGWGTVSTASGVLTGYALYRGLPGEETFIGNAGTAATTFLDNGLPQSDTIFPPTTNTTSGVKAKYIKRFEDRLVISGIFNDPTMVMISGKYPYQDRFNWNYGGGYVRVAPDSGDEIVGVEVAGTTSIGATTNSSILVFMKDKAFQMIIPTVELGNYIVLNPTYQEIAPIGASSFGGIVNIRNNTFYFGREGINTVGAEAAYLNQVRTREVSARIRPTILSYDDNVKASAAGGYMDYKYLLSFNNKQTIAYDYERAAFVGIWKTPFVITKWYRYIDSDGKENFLAGCDDGYVRSFSAVLHSDSGTQINKTVRFKREDFNRFNVMKTIQSFYLLFRNVSGTININFIIEDKNGLRTIAKSINIETTTGKTGWGTNLWGVKKWGQTINSVVAFLGDIIRWGYLYKTARTLLLEITTNQPQSNFEFVSFKASAQYQPEGSLPPSYRI